MCEFLSAIVLSNGTILTNPATDSHSVLIAHFADAHPQLKNDRPVNSDRAAFIRVEFKPAKLETIDQPDTYKLRVDETFRPGWFDQDMEFRVIDQLRDLVGRMILRNTKKDTLLGGAWILVDNSRVDHVVAARIIAIRNSTVQSVGAGGTVQRVWAGGTVQRVEAGGTVQGASANALVKANVGAIINGEKVGPVRTAV